MEGLHDGHDGHDGHGGPPAAARRIESARPPPLRAARRQGALSSPAPRRAERSFVFSGSRMIFRILWVAMRGRTLVEQSSPQGGGREKSAEDGGREKGAGGGGEGPSLLSPPGLRAGGRRCHVGAGNDGGDE